MFYLHDINIDPCTNMLWNYFDQLVHDNLQWGIRFSLNIFICSNQNGSLRHMKAKHTYKVWIDRYNYKYLVERRKDRTYCNWIFLLWNDAELQWFLTSQYAKESKTRPTSRKPPVGLQRSEYGFTWIWIFLQDIFTLIIICECNKHDTLK